MPGTDQGMVIEPFLVSGGASFYIDNVTPPFHPAVNGVQLVTSVYVPRGKLGFVKEIRVAPFMPPDLYDPWVTSGINNALTSWRAFDASVGVLERPGGFNGVWQTPFGWENYFDLTDEESLIPQWVWMLHFVRGDIALIRRNLPPFAVTDPASWYLVPNIAVPVAGYPSGIPGAAPSGAFGPQRMQVLQGDKLSTHVVVPEDTTVCLFTRWSQSLFQPKAITTDEETGETVVDYGDPLYPLLPSFGQLHGYMQAVSSEVSIDNSQLGWGG
jgi:hypothetical protein